MRLQSFFFWDNWHITPYPVNPNGLQISYDITFGSDNVVQGIEYCRQALINDTGLNFTENSMMLRLAVHLIGDIHQPLHCAQLYNSTFPNGDGVGTQLIVNTPKSQNISLHALWDKGVDMFDEMARPLTPDQ